MGRCYATFKTHWILKFFILKFITALVSQYKNLKLKVLISANLDFSFNVMFYVILSCIISWFLLLLDCFFFLVNSVMYLVTILFFYLIIILVLHWKPLSSGNTFFTSLVALKYINSTCHCFLQGICELVHSLWRLNFNSPQLKCRFYKNIKFNRSSRQF